MTVMTQQRGGSFLVEKLTAADIVCPEDMSDEERLLMRSIKEFAEQEVAPVADQVDQRNIDVISHGILVTLPKILEEPLPL